MTRVKGLRRELLRKFRQIGLSGTARHVAIKLVHNALRAVLFSAEAKVDPFDPKYGTNTGGTIGVGSLDIPEDQMEHSVCYVPIGEDEFTNTLNSLPVTCEEMLFVDLGSGKGRALLLASLFPFKKIIGVEFSAMLHEAALRNIQIFKNENQRCSEIEAMCGDAAAFKIPTQPTLFFLNNPFDHHVMSLVVSNMRDSLRGHRRQIYIWYVKPCYRRALDEADFLKIVRDTGRYIFYEGGSSPVQ